MKSSKALGDGSLRAVAGESEPRTCIFNWAAEWTTRFVCEIVLGMGHQRHKRHERNYEERLVELAWTTSLIFCGFLFFGG